MPNRRCDKRITPNNLLNILAFLYLPIGILLIFLLNFWVSRQLHWSSAWVALAIVISVIASLFVISRKGSLIFRAFVVVLLGIISIVILVLAKISQEYIIPASGFSLIASAITVVRGQLDANVESHEVSEFAFKLMSMMALAGGALIIAMSVSDWNWWNHMIGNVSTNSLAASEVNKAGRAADSFFAIALYYFLGIGLMVLEITQPRNSKI